LSRPALDYDLSASRREPPFNRFKSLASGTRSEAGELRHVSVELGDEAKNVKKYFAACGAPDTDAPLLS
jgi:hypothetical protein